METLCIFSTGVLVGVTVYSIADIVLHIVRCKKKAKKDWEDLLAAKERLRAKIMADNWRTELVPNYCNIVMVAELEEDLFDNPILRRKQFEVIDGGKE